MNQSALPPRPPEPTISSMRGPHEERIALVALLRQPETRWSDVTTDVLNQGSALDVLMTQFGAGEMLFHDDVSLQRALDEATALVDQWTAAGIGVHSLLDDSYPARLRDIHQMPPLVFSRGSLMEDRRDRSCRHA